MKKNPVDQLQKTPETPHELRSLCCEPSLLLNFLLKLIFDLPQKGATGRTGTRLGGFVTNLTNIGAASGPFVTLEMMNFPRWVFLPFGILCSFVKKAEVKVMEDFSFFWVVQRWASRSYQCEKTEAEPNLDLAVANYICCLIICIIILIKLLAFGLLLDYF